MRDPMLDESGEASDLYGHFHRINTTFNKDLANAQLSALTMLPEGKMVVAYRGRGSNTVAILDENYKILARKRLRNFFNGEAYTVVELHPFADGQLVACLRRGATAGYSLALFFDAALEKIRGSVDSYHLINKIGVSVAGVLADNTFVLAGRQGYASFSASGDMLNESCFESIYRKCIGILPEGTAVFITEHGKIEKRNLNSSQKETLPIKYELSNSKTKLPHQVCLLDNGNLVLCSEAGLRLWDEANKSARPVLSGWCENRSIFLHPDGGFVSVDKGLTGAKVRLWDDCGKLLQTFGDGFYNFGVRPSGEIVATARYGVSPVIFRQDGPRPRLSLSQCTIL